MFKSILRSSFSFIKKIAFISISATIITAVMAWSIPINKEKINHEMLVYTLYIMGMLMTIVVFYTDEIIKIKRELEVMQAINQEFYIKLKRLERERQNVTIHKIMKN